MAALWPSLMWPPVLEAFYHAKTGVQKDFTMKHCTVVRDAEISPQDPKIFVFKIEPGARSYMSGDPFGPKKPSISPYWDFAVTWQTRSWLKNGDFSRKKWYLLYGP